jgi:hypothetical protein
MHLDHPGYRHENNGNSVEGNDLQEKSVVPYAKNSTHFVTNDDRYGLRPRVRYMFFKRSDNRRLWMGFPLGGCKEKDYEVMAYMIAGRLYAVGANSDEVLSALSCWLQYHNVSMSDGAVEYVMAGASKSAERVICEWRASRKVRRNRNTTTLEILNAIEDGFLDSGAITVHICNADARMTPGAIRTQIHRLVKAGILKKEGKEYRVVQ